MSRRTERVAEAIRRLASEVLQTELRDPRMKELVTVTKVEVTSDLRLAKIFYTVLGDEKQKKRVFEGLKSAKNFVKKYIGDKLELRYTPDVMFVVDKKLEYVTRINEVLEKIHEEENDERPKKDSSDTKEIK